MKILRYFMPIAAACLCHLAVAKQPNIIYINTDDWGIGKANPYDMDPTGSEIIKTPHLDQLRQDGMLFTNAYAGNAVCGPSRCSLLTGKHPGNAPWRANGEEAPGVAWPPAYPMLGEVARMGGYATAAFGKVSPGGTEKPENVAKAGWDYWLGYLGHIDVRSYYNDHVWENGERIPLPKNTEELHRAAKITKKGGTGEVGEGVGTFTEDLYADRIIDFIKENNAKEKPFFVYFASCVPHGGAGFLTPSLAPYDKMDLTPLERVYCALMTRHDRNVGRIRATLKELGIDDNTIIMWSSDNGDEDSYYKRTDTFDGNGDYRAQKRSLYEGGIRVPLIACWPGTIKPGSTSDLITTQWDVMTTVAEAGGVAKTKEMDGISILSTLRGDTNKQAGREYIYFEYHTGGRQQSVRMGKWKAYRNGGPAAPMEIYNLETDVAEEKDLASTMPELAARMASIMEKGHSPHPKYTFEGSEAFVAEMKEHARKKAEKAAKTGKKTPVASADKKKSAPMTAEEKAKKQKAKLKNLEAKEKKRKEREASSK